MPDNPTKILARFVANAKYEDLPDQALALGRSSLLDASGTGLAGSASKGAKALNSVLESYASIDGTPVIGTNIRLPAPFAAMANGNSIHSDDFDDTLRADPNAEGYHGSTHPSGPLLSALMALTDKRKVNGKYCLYMKSSATLGTENAVGVAAITMGMKGQGGFQSLKTAIAV